MGNTFLKHLYEFAERNEISRDKLRQLVLSGQSMRLYGKKLDGSNIVRDFHSVTGPSGNILYDYDALNYMILYDETSEGFRTILMNKISKVMINNKTFIVI